MVLNWKLLVSPYPQLLRKNSEEMKPTPAKAINGRLSRQRILLNTEMEIFY